MKIGLSAVGKIYCICALFHNARTYFIEIKFLSFKFICLGDHSIIAFALIAGIHQIVNICEQGDGGEGGGGGGVSHQYERSHINFF